ncbi:MAG: hypothetical protein ABIM99_04360 [Candidatus Dojkabacteria bacterium]
MQVLKLQQPSFKYKNKKELEDSILHDGNIFAIADGITRDPVGFSDFTNLTEEQIVNSYPKPSPAKIASDTFTKNFVESLKQRTELNLDNLESSFILGNTKIKELNLEKNPNPDFLANDYWACVATGVVINENNLMWGAIGDCGVRIYDENWNIKFNTPNSVEVYEKYFYSDANPYRTNYDWNKPESRILNRKEFRNNPKQVQNDECVSYGSLTGEEIALNFLYFGNVYISQKDTIVIYSDGFLKTMDEPRFIDVLKNASKNNSLEEFEKYDFELASKDYSNYGHERSIMIVNL